MTDKERRNLPEFRKDPVSGDWILVASGRRNRPQFFSAKGGSAHDGKKIAPVKKNVKGIKDCPFDNPQKSGNPLPLLWYPHPNTPSSKMEDLDSWFVQVVPNKYPLLFHRDQCPMPEKESGAEEMLPAVGYHEVIITRDHNRTMDKMTIEEIQLVLKSYKERYRVLSQDSCVKYILIFHNQGETAGASVAHPHSQLVALPVVDPDVVSSLNGSLNFWKIYKKCVHCSMVEQEIKEKLRVVSKNKHFVSLVPFAPRVSCETRIYPLKHAFRFEDMDKELFPFLAEILKDALIRLNKALESPDYNFFIHTAPVGDGNFGHYHWHLEILPRSFKWAGLELGMGIEVVAVPPEEAARNLKKVKAWRL